MNKVNLKSLRAKLRDAARVGVSIEVTSDEARALLPSNELYECDHCHVLVRTPAALHRDQVSPLDDEARAEHDEACPWVVWVENRGPQP